MSEKEDKRPQGLSYSDVQDAVYKVLDAVADGAKQGHAGPQAVQIVADAARRWGAMRQPIEEGDN